MSSKLYLTVIVFSVYLLNRLIFAEYMPLTGFENCFITKDVCPNENISFYLYTRTIDKPHQLNLKYPETVTEAKFVPNSQIIILIHGYTGHKDFSPNTEIRPVYLEYGDYNIISVDYHPLAPKPCYLQAVQNIPTVAKCLAQLIDFIVFKTSFTLNDIHIIGFSLGAQTAGMIPVYLKSGILKRITGLDPAKPLFIFANQDYKLDSGDAEFVDVIHTDVLERGVLSSAGHVDFYINGGIEQPGCKLQENESAGSCNHVRAVQYYAESIKSSVGFWGFKCDSWIYWGLGICRPSTSTELAIMGMRASKDARGMFFLNANEFPPFAKGIIPEFQLNITNGSYPNSTNILIRENIEKN